MPRSPRFPAPDRPDPEARLLAAAAERDSQLASRLAEQFVHRRGVAALENLLLRKLEPTQGAEACSWLATLVGVDTPCRPAAAVAAQVPAATVVVETPVTPVVPELSAADPWAPVAAGLDWGIGSSSAADSSAEDGGSTGVAVESGAALIASWLQDLGREQADLDQLAEAWKPGESEVAEPQTAALELQQSELMVFGGGSSPAAVPSNSTPPSLVEAQPQPMAQAAPQAPPLNPPLPAQQPDSDPLLRRLQAVATPNGQDPRTAQLAPVPASLARLRSWLHDDQLPEAS